MDAATLAAGRGVSRALESIGAAGVVGIALLVFCATFYLGTLRPSAENLTRLEQHRAKLEAVAAPTRGEGSTLREQLDVFYDRLPKASGTEAAAEQIFTVARKFGVALRQGSYRYVNEPAGVVGRYEITYTAVSEYYRIRLMLRELHAEMPSLALEDIAFQRPQSSVPAPEVTLKFSLYVRAR
jgi:hypothetical protein